MDNSDFTNFGNKIGPVPDLQGITLQHFTDWQEDGWKHCVYRFKVLGKAIKIKTSLLRRLQAQTLPEATPPIGQIHPFSKMAVTFEPLKGCRDLESS